MKKKIYLLTTITLSAAVLSLSSCLKDGNKFVDFSNVGTLVELPLSAFSGTGKLTAAALAITDTPQTIPVIVNVASPKPLSSALTVTLALDEPALTAYNHANGLDTGGNVPYTILPPADYTISNYKVTVPANQRQARMIIKVNTNVVDPAGHFILPLSIVDASGQKISNYKTILYNVQAKNKYDGNYHATGERIHPKLGILPFDYVVDMVTSSANSIDGGALADTQQDLNLVINPDNSVTPTSTYQTLFVPSGQTNTYDPATKTFTLHVAYNTGAPRIMNITLVKQ